MLRYLVLSYGILAYGVFVVSAVLLARLLAVVPSELPVSGVAVATNLGFLALFFVPHSIMARRSFKAWWTRIVPDVIERSTYVLISALVLIALCLYWRDLPGCLWNVDVPWLIWTLRTMSVGSLVLVLYSSWLTREADLFGVRRTWRYSRGEPYEPVLRLCQHSLYRWVRHPMMVGLIALLWMTPTMSWNRLMFVVAGTTYILMATEFEERDLRRHFGECYREYSTQVPRYFPRLISACPADEIDV